MSTSSAASSSAGTGAAPGASTVWQDKLQGHCAAHGMRPPVYSIASDRRGGRTAWSSTVEVQGQHIRARYWYDGQYVNNAKEDAACEALQRLGQVPAPTTQQRWQGYGALSP